MTAGTAAGAGANGSAFDGIGLDALALRVASDLDCLCYPPTDWVPDGGHAIPADAEAGAEASADADVLIVGGGMCGLLAWFALQKAGIRRVRIVDQADSGVEGPWLTYARMETLRSPKHLAGPAYGLGSLTFQAWYRARHGRDAWDALDKIPRPMWMDYLCWYREVLGVPVENGTELTAVMPDDGGDSLRVTLAAHGSERTHRIRKLIYATGRDGIARPNLPSFVDTLPRKCWAHSSDDIDFAALKNRRVVVVGVGASAVDNAAEALEAGAAEVRHLIRREQMPTINKMMGIGSYGFVAAYPDLSDAWRWRFMQYSFATQTPAPRGSTLRVSRHANAFFHFGKAIARIDHGESGLAIAFTDGTSLETDYVILGTGFTTDPMARRELGEAAGEILLWRDVYTPPEDERSDDLGRFPYLAGDFTFRNRKPGTAEWLRHVYCFNYGATASLGKVSGDIPGISEGARWLVRAIASTLYREDIAVHWQGLNDYDKPELLGDEWQASPLPDAGAARRAL